MATVQAIFTQLGVDSSLWPQFIIVLVLFILAQKLFLGKLQTVLETREANTVGLETSADETIEKVSKMQSEYKLKIEDANRTALKTSSDKKQQITQKYTESYKQTEKEVGQFVDQSRNEFSKELEGSKDKYLAEAESLSQSLVQKILQ
jgi:F0F1-type ATP synthase membrane subunit b/b'